jgi:hypothetical protein
LWERDCVGTLGCPMANASEKLGKGVFLRCAVAFHDTADCFGLSRFRIDLD